MSKHKQHNYTQYSDKKHQSNTNVVARNVADEEGFKPITQPPKIKMDTVPQVDLVNETVETQPIPKTVDGMVVGCAKLNVRAEANLFSDVVCTLNAQSEIEIDVEKSNKDWLYICTASGIEGYCMRKYVEAHL